MRIPTKIHGIIDYVAAGILFAAPCLCGFNDVRAALVPMSLAVATVLYSLFTKYEWGLCPVLSMKTHLLLDALNAIFLAASPWLFGFAGIVYLPHLVIGCCEFLVVVFSDPKAREHAGRTNKRAEVSGYK